MFFDYSSRSKTCNNGNRESRHDEQFDLVDHYRRSLSLRELVTIGNEYGLMVYEIVEIVKKCYIQGNRLDVNS